MDLLGLMVRSQRGVLHLVGGSAALERTLPMWYQLVGVSAGVWAGVALCRCYVVLLGGGVDPRWSHGPHPVTHIQPIRGLSPVYKLGPSPDLGRSLGATTCPSLVQLCPKPDAPQEPRYTGQWAPHLCAPPLILSGIWGWYCLLQKQRHYFADKGLSSQSYVFSSSHVRMWELDSKKKTECQKVDAFELWYWRRLLRVPWTARRSNQSILKEIKPEYSLEGLMLKLKLQYFLYLIKELTHWKRPWCWERLKEGR